jgi:hypothetical protein
MKNNQCNINFGICDGGNFCSNCGNGICDKNENVCNCPKDCNNTLVGNTCGTVSPDSRETCCKDRGYESWNDETGTCKNNSDVEENENNRTTDEQEHNSVISARENNLSKREKTEITAESRGTQTKVKIDKKIYTTSVNQSDIIAEVISKFAIDKITADDLLKLETNSEDQSEIDEENTFKVEVNLNSKFSAVSIEKKFVLNTTNRDEILNSIVSGSQLTLNEVKDAIETKDLKDIRKEEHKLKFKNAQCPLGCECMGSVIRCEFENGTRVMTITAGKSGNIIIQIKGENMTTNVTLYKSEDKVYGVFSGNETREIKVLPDQVKENIKAKIKARLQNENVILNESGTYEYNAEKQAKLFLLIPVKVEIKADIDSETGTVSNIQSPWWSALAKDE